MNIAFFFYNWGIFIYTANIINKFSQYNNNVYLFIYDNIEERYIFNKSINIYRIKRPYFLRILKKIFTKIYIKNLLNNKIRKLLFQIIINIDKYFFIKYIKKTSIEFDIIFGIEKGGAYMAYKYANIFKTPYIYHSLEVYGPNSAVFAWEPVIKTLFEQEKIFSSPAAGILIQDESRWQYFKTYTNVSDSKKIIFPISVTRNNITINRRENICVCFGNIYCSPEDLILASNNLPDSWKIMLHNTSIPQSFLHLNTHKNIIISTKNLNETEICHLLQKSKIGLAFYPPFEENNKLIIYSSEKIARYLASKIPFIINEKLNAKNLFSKFCCGIEIESIKDIPNAILYINERYDLFSSQADIAFNKIYNFDVNFKKIYTITEKLISKKIS